MDEEGRTKGSKAERCYLALLALGHARAEYVESLEGGSPGPAVPRFGTSVAGGLPYERLVRTCHLAAAFDPHEPRLDAALMQGFALATLAKHLNDAASYYGKLENEADGFERGRELHASIVSGFSKLDDARNDLRAALPDFCKARPRERQTRTAGLAHAVADAAVAAFLAVHDDQPKPETRAAVARLSVSIVALEGAAPKQERDPFVVLVPGAARRVQAAIDAFDGGTGQRVPIVSRLEALLTAVERAHEREVARMKSPDESAKP